MHRRTSRVSEGDFAFKTLVSHSRSEAADRHTMSSHVGSPMGLTTGLAPDASDRHALGASRQTLAMLWFLFLATSAGVAVRADDPSVYLSNNAQHHLLDASMPPGVIAATRQRMAAVPAPPYYQPVRFQGPPGTSFSLAEAGSFSEGDADLMAGLMVGRVYRFQVTGIPGAAGAELYPSVEMVDRTYPPPGLATSYPIPINLDREDMLAALDGQLVTRVIYLEDPQTATPLAQPKTGPVAIEVPQYQDPLHAADRLGRPVAIVRIGSLAPPRSSALAGQFFFGHPAWAPIFQPEP